MQGRNTGESMWKSTIRPASFQSLYLHSALFLSVSSPSVLNAQGSLGPAMALPILLNLLHKGRCNQYLPHLLRFQWQPRAQYQWSSLWRTNEFIWLPYRPQGKCWVQRCRFHPPSTHIHTPVAHLESPYQTGVRAFMQWYRCYLPLVVTCCPLPPINPSLSLRHLQIR